MKIPEALGPGSSEPEDPSEVDRLLTFVPELAFLPAFEPCVPDLEDASPSHEAVDAWFTAELLAAVATALRAVGSDAETNNSGGLAFVARTMLHFIEVEPVRGSQHPLLVALFLRGIARASSTADNARAIASAMDRWS